MYALCDLHGFPDIFFTITIGDECSFCIRVWARPGVEFKMPSLDYTDKQCYEDYIICQDVRLRYPGVCSLEYQSCVQIALETLFGWDFKKQTGTEGIYGKLKAYAIGHEEQGRAKLFGIEMRGSRTSNLSGMICFIGTERFKAMLGRSTCHS